MHLFIKIRIRSKKKKNFNRVFDSKIIIDFSFKIRFQITTENEFDFKKKKWKKKKFFKQKNNAYMIADDEKKVDYYKLNNENESNDNEKFNANHENENSSSNSFDQKNSFVELMNSFMKIEINFVVQCKKCRITFLFNNKLHRHIRNECKNFLWKRKAKSYNIITKISFKIENSKSSDSFFIIMFSVDFNQNLKTDFEFRNYQYATIQFFLIKSVSKQPDCLNTETDFIIINKIFFLFQFKKPIRIIITEITIRGIDVDKHRTKKYVICFIYFSDVNDKKRKIRVCIRREIHLMKNFKINVLIETDILTSKKFVLNFKKNETFIKNCSIIISIISKRHEKIINQIMNLKKIIIISFHFEFQIRIHHLNFSEKKNFLFESKSVDFDLYAHIIETETSDILIRNEQNKSLRISRNVYLDRVMKMKYSNVCHVTTNDVINLAIRKPKSFHRKAYFQRLLKSYLFVVEIDSAESETTIRIKKKIIIHNADPIFTKQLLELINNHSAIWTDQGFAILSEDEWKRMTHGEVYRRWVTPWI